MTDRFPAGSGRYAADAPASEALCDRARAIVPGGVNSPVRAFRAVGGAPRFMVRGEGAWLARVAAEGREAVLVSHQLPIWTLRRHVERKRLWHDPRRRRWGLASLTSFRFDDAKVVGIGYTEPAAHLIAMSPTVRKAKGA